MEISIKEEPAQEIWKALKAKVGGEEETCLYAPRHHELIFPSMQEFMGEHYPFFVAWENLIQALAKVLNVPELKTSSTDKAYLCLRTLLGTP